MSDDRNGKIVTAAGSSTSPKNTPDASKSAQILPITARQQATPAPSPSLEPWRLTTASETCLARLSNWTFAEPLPAAIDDALIRQTAADLDAGLIPASAVQASQELATVFALVGCPAGMDTKAAAAAYLAAFEDVPLDLLQDACRMTIRTAKFAPKPADIRQHIDAPLANRQYQRRRLETAALKWRQEAPQRERAAQIAAERATGRNLYSLDDVKAAMKRMPVDDGA